MLGRLSDQSHSAPPSMIGYARRRLHQDVRPKEKQRRSHQSVPSPLGIHCATFFFDFKQPLFCPRKTSKLKPASASTPGPHCTDRTVLQCNAHKAHTFRQPAGSATLLPPILITPLRTSPTLHDYMADSPTMQGSSTRLLPARQRREPSSCAIVRSLSKT